MMGLGADFLKLWIGQTVSLLGSRVTSLALPLTAILVLHAGPTQVGLLQASGSAALLLSGLVAGVWADRGRRRPIMIAANLGSALCLFSIPLASWLGVLHLPQLYLVSFLAAGLGVFFSVAYRAYIPSLVPRDRLVEANSRLTISASTAQIAGPAAGGALIAALTAPVAILADALSFAASALSLLAIGTREPAVQRAEEESMVSEALGGARMVLRHSILRALSGASALFNLFDSMLFAVYVLYMSHTLGLTPTTIGLVFGLAGAGGLGGAFLATPLTARLGLGRAIVSGIVLLTAGELLIAASRGPQLVAAAVLLLAEAAVELGDALYSINTASLTVAVTPDSLRGRVTAANALASMALSPVGALLGGLLGSTAGLRQTVVIAGAGTLLCLIPIVLSPLRDLRDMPGPPEM